MFKFYLFGVTLPFESHGSSYILILISIFSDSADKTA